MPDIAAPGGPRGLRLPTGPPTAASASKGRGEGPPPVARWIPDAGVGAEKRWVQRGGEITHQLFNLRVVHRWRLWPRLPGGMRLLTRPAARPRRRGDDTLLAPDGLSRSHYNRKYGFRAEQQRMKGACLRDGESIWSSRATAPFGHKVLLLLLSCPIRHDTLKVEKQMNGYLSATAKDLLRISSEGQFLQNGYSLSPLCSQLLLGTKPLKESMAS